MNTRGKLLIIGFGPGALEHITGRALAALDESEAVIGYNTYVELIQPLLRHQEIVGTGMTEEVSRAQEAVRRAEAGQIVAVISSGDAGVYGMAGLVYEVLIERGWKRDEGVEVEVIPGISAIQSCSSLLGAPIMHDACTISLSDHLTPWESIAARIDAAGSADFVVAFYNPRSGKRTQQIEEARRILLRYRDPSTPVGIVKSAYRDRQHTVVTTLQDMLEHEIGMLSTVVVGNSATAVYEGIMVTPRGYDRKYNLTAETQALKPHERLRTSSEPWSLAASAIISTGSAKGNEEPAEVEISPALGSHSFSGEQLMLIAEWAGTNGQLQSLRNGHYLLRSTASRVEGMLERLEASGVRICRPGKVVRVSTCDFCELKKEEGLRAAERLLLKFEGLPVPRELSIQVNGCGMACGGAVLADIGVILSKGRFEIYIGGKRTGKLAYPGILVHQGLNEHEVLTAVLNIVENYREQGYANERFHAFFERIGGANSGIWHRNSNDQAAGGKTMKTVLLVGHGSRVQEGNDQLREFANRLAARKPEIKFETCFIELAQPSMAEGIANCVNGGATKVYVVPIILFAAGHSKLDIPSAIDRAKQKYPWVEFIYGNPIGVHEKAVDILIDRIAEAVPLTQPDLPDAKARQSRIDDKDTIVLVMGRGGSDPSANSDFCKMTRLLWERTPYKSVESCFIAIAKPSLTEGLERCLSLGARKIIVLPYLLFTGVLIKQFAEMVSQFAAAHREVEVAIGSHLGFHPLLGDMMIERIEETLAGQSFANCDSCKYRQDAAGHHHHHHHGDDDHGHDHDSHSHVHHHHEHDNHNHGHHHHEHDNHNHGHHQRDQIEAEHMDGSQTEPRQKQPPGGNALAASSSEHQLP
ncbi:precorrin-3B C(17)-methyltransferase [Paenibacillus sp. sgz500958]|uniref:precorrin-3B C(17)-methyltransferase n=1 Tax=Paenibacillus sp. sgz500958 TaxID=3242475 RepID=UPI0036D28979